MISLKEKGILLVNAFEDEIVQEANSDYQLSFKYPTSDSKWSEIEVGALVLADDVHGEQEFRIFEITKRNSYIFVYANQVSFDLNEYLISAISVDRAPGQMVMSALAGSVIRHHPFSFFSDIQDRHTLNQKSVSVMDALAKGKHSIIGQWGGDLVRDKYSLRLLAHGGRDTEHLFMYKKNLKFYAETDSMKGLVTRLHLRKTVQGQEGTADQVLEAVVDSPLIDAYKGRIFEHAIEVSDENITTRDQLVEYGQDYFRKNLPDVPKNSLTIEVTDNHSYDVRLFDTVLVHHEVFGKDLRLKITSYKFSPMSRKLKSIGFGKTKTNLHQQISSAVDSGIEQAKSALDSDFDRKLQKQIDNANQAFEAEFEKNKQAIEDGIEEAKAAAEVIKAEVGQSVLEAENKANQALQSMTAADQKASEALTRAGASSDLAKLAKEIADRAAASSAQTGQELANKSRELQEAVRLARENLSSQADQIRRQVQAQEGLSSRLTTVEETANGTKATLTELSKTVNSTTGNLTSVTQRMASAEAGLSSVREQYSQLNQALNTTTGQVQSVSQKTADIERGLDGVRERFDSIRVGGVNLLKNTETMSGAGWSSSGQVWRKSQETYRKQPIFEWVSGGKYTPIAYYSVTPGETYTFSTYVKKGSQGRIFLYLYDDNKFLNVNRDRIFQLEADKFSLISVTFTAERVGTLAIRLAMIAEEQGGFSHTPFKLEHGTIPTDWSPAEEDLRQEFAEYKRTADENSAQLSQAIQTTDGKASQAQTLAQQTATSLLTKADRTTVDNLTGRMTNAETKIETVAGRITTEIAKTKALIPTKGSSVNLVPNSKINKSSNAYGFDTRTVNLVAGKTYWFGARAKKTGGTTDKKVLVALYYPDWSDTKGLYFETTDYEIKFDKFIPKKTGEYQIRSYWYPNGGDRSGTADIDWYTVVQSDLEPTDYSPAPEDLQAEIESVKTTITQTAEGVEQLSQSIKNVDGKVTTAEANIKNLTNEISTRLTRAEVDSLVTSKGYLSNTVFDNYRRETAQTIERGLTETRALIPRQIGGTNLIPGTRTMADFNLANSDWALESETYRGLSVWSRGHEWNGIHKPVMVYAGETYTFSAYVKRRSTGKVTIFLHHRRDSSTHGQTDVHAKNFYGVGSDWQRISHTFTATKTGTIIPRVEIAERDKLYAAGYKLERGTVATDWSEAPEDNVSTVDFNRVKETAQLYERVLGRTEGDVATNVARQVMTSQLFQTEVTKQQTDSELLSRMADGVPMTGNKHFATDLAGYNVYDNARTGHVTISRVSDNLSSSGYAMMIKTSGSGTSPWLGGFYSTVNTAKNKEFLVRLVAKIPIGRKIYFHHNPLGAGASWRWLSSVDGTGNYATYVAYVKSGYEGHFSNFGFWAIGGGETPTTSSPLVWYVSEYQVYDITNSRTEALTTRVTQLADRYAITTLGSANQVLSAVNVATGGVALQAGQNKLVVTPNTTYIQDGTIKNAMIESLYGGKIQAGTVGTAVLQAEAVTADKLKVDQAFFNKFMANEARLKQLFAKDAFITSVQSVSISANQISGGKLTALNKAMEVNLNQANITFNKNATIEFNSANNALVRRKGTHTAFVHFNDVSSSSDGGVGSLYASIGVTSSGDGINSASSGRFCGARFFRGARGTEHTATVDQAEVYGDSIILKDGFDGTRGFKFTPTTIGGMIDMNYLVGAVRALARCWLHMNNVAWNPQNNNLGRAVINEYNNYMKDL